MRVHASVPSLFLAASIQAVAAGTGIYATDFNTYNTGTLSGQLAWIGTGGTWAVSGTVNSPQLAASVIGPGVVPGVNPYGGKGRMVRLCTERFAGGRTKAWLDLANSGRWAAASAGGERTLETRIRLYVPAGQALASGFGVMISRSPAEVSGGFVVAAQTGAISLLDGGYAAANRIATGASAPLDAWNEIIYRWNVDTGAGTLVVNGATVATHATTPLGSVYASNLLAVTDAAPGSLNAFGYFEDLSLAAVADPAPCPADLDGNGIVGAADLSILLGAWSTSGADLDGNGLTDAADLSILLGSWGTCP